MHVGGAGGGHDLIFGGVGLGVQQIVADRGVEQERILRDRGDLGPEALLLNVPQVVSVEGDAPFRRIAEARQKVRDRGLPGSTGADQGNALAGEDLEGDVAERKLVARGGRRGVICRVGRDGVRAIRRSGVGEADVLDPDATLD